MGCQRWAELLAGVLAFFLLEVMECWIDGLDWLSAVIVGMRVSRLCRCSSRAFPSKSQNGNRPRPSEIRSTRKLTHRDRIVEYATREQAQNAVNTLSNQQLMGRLVYVREVRAAPFISL